MINQFFRRTIWLLSLAACAVPPALAASLNIDTDYRMRGIAYTNNDFDTRSSTDSAGYYSQRLRLAISGKFDPDIEIGMRLSAVGVAGSTSTFFSTPYPNTDFSPFVELAYIRLNGIADQPVDAVFGRQPFEYGDGLIVSDNGVGLTGMRFIGRLARPLAMETELFTAKVKEGFYPGKDMNISGAVGSFNWRELSWQLGYFEERDQSGTPYTRGLATYATKSIIKTFYDIRMGRKDRVSSYQLEIAKQGGSVTRDDNTSISFDGLGYVARGELIGEKTKLGKVSAHAMIAVFSGEGDLGSFTDDHTFAPTLTRRFDGLEQAGFGELFAATPQGSFFTLPASYSGIDTLNIGAFFSPLYAWTLGVDYYLYSASQGPKGAPTASGFERLFGAEFTLGVEMDLSVAYVISKYAEARLSYSRYTPPKFEALWPTSDPATRYQLEIAAKF